MNNPSPPPNPTDTADSSVTADATLDAIGLEAREAMTAAGTVTADTVTAGEAAPPPPPPPLTVSDVMPWAVMLVKQGGKWVTDQTGVAYSSETVTEVAEALAPVIVKHQVMPAWLIPYQEELKLGMVLAGVAFKTWSMVNAARKQEAANGTATSQPAPQTA